MTNSSRTDADTTVVPDVMHPKYRPDIDGLRAVAVLSVMMYHAFPATLRGGFVGVDIFFVISGFLISTIIFKGLEKNQFSFVDFYSRRVRRIFPALVVVLLTTFTLGWFILYQDEYRQLGKHIAGGAGFLSNFVLWRESGYFDAAAETKPLLHLWSLGIEEQFYIVFPVFAYLLWKVRLNALSVLTLLGVISFALNLKFVHRDAALTFYMPQTRGWELLIGCALALLTLDFSGAWPRLRASGQDSCKRLMHKAGVERVARNSLGECRGMVGCAADLGSVMEDHQGHAFPGQMGIVANTGCCFPDLGGPACLCEPGLAIEPDTGVGGQDQLSPVPVALGAADLLPHSARREVYRRSAVPDVRANDSSRLAKL